MTKILHLGLIGYGQGRMYADTLRCYRVFYPNLPEVELTAICTLSLPESQRALTISGFKRIQNDFNELINSSDIDIIIIATPPSTHYSYLKACLYTQKGIFLDKPLSIDFNHANELITLSKELSRDARLGFQYRFNPALLYAKDLINSGVLGEIYNYRATYNRSSAVKNNKSLGWKGNIELCGDGVLFDYGPHPIDLINWLVGIPEKVSAIRKIFIPKRPRSREDMDLVEITTADHYTILFSSSNGPVGSLDLGRLIVGSENDLSIQLYGSKGSISWSLMDPNFLYKADISYKSNKGVAWEKIPTIQKYPGLDFPSGDSPMGLFRMHLASMADFISSFIQNQSFVPGIIDGYNVQKILNACVISANNNCWQDVN